MKKPLLSFGQIMNMSVGFMGIQFGFALQNANVSRIFETLGANVDDIPILWVAAPVTGLLVQPIIGYMSDRTWNRLGRRRPYFLVGAILSSIALFFMPNSPSLWLAAILLWLMDASINISMEPFRAFVGDNLPDEQRTTGFAAQVFFIGIGAVIASFMPWILSNVFGFANTAPEGVVPGSVRWSFYFGAIVFLLAVLWTVLFSKEYDPDQLAAYEAAESTSTEYSPQSMNADARASYGSSQITRGALILGIGIGLAVWFFSAALDKQLHVLSFGTMLYGLLLIVSGLLQRAGQYQSGFVTIMNDLQHMPETMKQLSAVQFFSWFALFSMWIYTTAAVTSGIYGSSDTTSQAYNDGADWVGICFGVYNGLAIPFAFLLPVIAKRYGRKLTHIICLVAGAIGLVSIFFIAEPMLLLLSMVGIGLAWSSILSMPYAMLTGALPASKMGYYMGVFNFFIVIPQIIAAAVLGFIIGRVFDGQPIYAMIIGGISFLIAAVATLGVNDKTDPIHKRREVAI
ncbi:MAG: MFS transporter [Bacteroidota bacterium]